MTEIHAWIIRWQAGDNCAGEALYNYHRESIYRLAYALLGDLNDAEEVVQDALLYALTHVDRYDPNRASFATWLHTIAVSRCRDHYRRQNISRLLLPRRPQLEQNLPDPRPTPEQYIIQSESYDEIWQAIRELSQPLREAIVLRHWAGHTYHEMAQILGCPIRTAQSRVRLAYQNLRSKIITASKSDFEIEEIR